MPTTPLSELIDRYESDLLSEWLRQLTEHLGGHRERIPETQLRSNSRDFLYALREASAHGLDISRPEWSKVRDFLTDFSRQRATQGFTPSETAMFVFSLKQPLFDRLSRDFEDDPKACSEQVLVNV